MKFDFLDTHFYAKYTPKVFEFLGIFLETAYLAFVVNTTSSDYFNYNIYNIWAILPRPTASQNALRIILS